MEFARRSRKLYAQREAVVDGELRLTYAQFFERCDRASAALYKLGIGKGDRVATIAPNTVAHLEQFYAVPQLGAVVVPLNYRLIAEDFVYLINHSGARVVCAHSDYLDMVEGIRARSRPSSAISGLIETRAPSTRTSPTASSTMW
jgi:fatty-acyl-CoA synthase